MTSDGTDLKQILEKLDRRLYKTEQIVTSPQVMGQSSVFEDGIVIGGPDGVVIDLTPPGGAVGVTATPGAVHNNVFVDVEWEPPTEGFAGQYDVELAEVVGGAPVLLNVFQTSGTNYRIENLRPGQDYAVRVLPFTSIGIRPVDTPDWTYFTAVKDSTIPPAPTGVVLGRGATTVIVKYEPLSEEDAPDVANGNGIYEIQIDTHLGFISPNLREMRSSDQIVAFNDVFEEATWFARVRAIDSSGNVGPWSELSEDFDAGGVTDNMILAGLDAAKITVGFLSGSRIEADSIEANRLTTSQLTAANIRLNGGAITAGANPTSTGIVLNSQGLRGYKSGTLQFALDAATGNATFSGTVNGATITGGSINGTTITTQLFRSAASGSRIEIDTISHHNEIRFYGDRTEYMPALMQVSSYYTTTADTYSYIALQSAQRFSNGNRSLIMADGSSSGATIALQTFGSSSNNTILLAAPRVNLNAETIAVPLMVSSASAGSAVHVRTGVFPVYLFRYTSSARYKRDIVNLSEEMPTDLIFDFDYVAFTPQTLDGEEDGTRTFGVLAEQIIDVCSARGIPSDMFVACNPDGSAAAFHYDRLAIPAVIELMKVRDRLAELERKVEWMAHR